MQNLIAHIQNQKIPFSLLMILNYRLKNDLCLLILLDVKQSMAQMCLL